jgi:ubiquinone/menaquinone biosynthesis C-methylase UbiE
MADRTDKELHAASFGSVAEIYETNRPGYPAETVSWLLDDQPARVIDVGAGTGKLTRLLTESGRTVTAVDPSELMLDRLRGALPDVDRLVGTAERLPLPDRSAELITVAQAWHWVDPPLASAEIGRVLRPGGRLGLVWNLRDERVGWVRDLGVGDARRRRPVRRRARGPGGGRAVRRAGAVRGRVDTRAEPGWVAGPDPFA